MFTLASSQDIDFKWLKILGEGGQNTGTWISSDDSGNIYVGGFFENIITIDDTLLISNGNKDIILLKLDSNGKLLWLKHYGSKSEDLISDLYIHINTLCTVGTFSDTLIFK